MPELTIVSAASSNHFQCLINLLHSIDRSRVEGRKIVYDLGLDDSESRALAARCDSVRKFDFAAYPRHLDIRVNAGEYAWKPVIVADVLAEFGGLVLWLDAGDLVYGNLERVRSILIKNGVYAPLGGGTIREWTHPGTLRYLGVTPDLSGKRNRTAAIVGLNAEFPGAPQLAQLWKECALTKACIAPEGSSRSNHRQDQATLSVLIYTLQRIYGFRLVHSQEEVCTHKDRLAPQRVDEEIAAQRRLYRRNRWRRWAGPYRHALVSRLESRGEPEWRGPRVEASARPRIVHVGHGRLPIPPLGWGAVERDIWNLHRTSEQNGLESAVINSMGAREIIRQCRAYDPDMIDVHAEQWVAACRSYARAHPIPIILTSHDFRLSYELPREIEKAARLVDGIIALSPSIRDRFIAHGFDNVHCIPNGVNTEVFRPLEKKPKTVLAVARNTHRKKLPEVARFFLSKPDYHLTICGPLTDRRDRKSPAIPGGPNITIFGARSEAEIARLFGESEYFVHLCEVEACALVVREAMACACKVWTAPYNAQGLENVALSWDQAVNDSTLGERAAREAREKLDWSIISRQTADIVRSMLAAWERGRAQHRRTVYSLGKSGRTWGRT